MLGPKKCASLKNVKTVKRGIATKARARPRTPATKTQTRKFGGGVSHDPSFSTITADVDRMAQAKKYPLMRLSHLENGLRIATEPQDSDVVTIGVFVDAGTRYETDHNNGVAHFLEHTLFKGTTKRTRSQLELEVEQMGGSLNAFTSREQTVFTATVPKKNTKNAIELLGDILLNSRISAESVEAERSVILEEMDSVNEDLQEVVYDRLHETAFRGSSLSRTILGPVHNINTISKQTIDDYVNTHYIAPRMVVAAVGDVDHAEVAASVEKHFGALPKQPRNGIRPNKGIANFTGSMLRVRDDDMSKAYIAVGFETAGWNDPDHYALMSLQMMLGSMSIDRMTDMYSSNDMVSQWSSYHAADSVTPFNTIYSDTGIFGLYAVANPNTVDAISNDLPRALIHYNTHVPAQGLREAHSKLKLSLLSQYEGTENTCQELGRQLLSHGRRLHPMEVIARIDAVDQMAVQQVTKRFFYDQDFAVAGVGAVYELPEYPQMRKKCYTNWY